MTRSTSPEETPGSERVVEQTLCWLRSVVIGLNLCPFAKQELINQRIRLTCSESRSPATLLDQLRDELDFLDHHPEIETTLLIHPGTLNNFDHYNQFLDRVDQLIESHQWLGIYQVASFHPHYRFAETGEEDAENYTNRSPYPMLHLLREASLQRAIESYGDTSGIPTRNIKLMNRLGRQRLVEQLTRCMEGTPVDGR